MRKFIISLAALLAITAGLLLAQQGNQVIPAPGAPNLALFYVSPNCTGNTSQNCTLISTIGTPAQNATAFAAAFASANAYSGTVVGPVQPLTAPTNFHGNAGVTTINVNADIPKGSTVYVFFFDSNGSAVTITSDTCASACGFSKVGSTVSNTVGTQVYATALSAATQASVLTLTQGGPAELMDALVVVLPGATANVTSAGATGTNTSTSVSQTTTQSNSMILSACGWYNASSNVTLTNTAGTLLLNQPETGTAGSTIGEAIWGTFDPASGTNTTSSGTLSASSAWACQSVEVQGGGTSPNAPTVHIGQGVYYYSSGISLANPAGMTMECEPGTFLNYTGTGHAVDVGVQSLTAVTGSNRFRYVIQNCTFTGGLNASEGIYLQPYNAMINLRGNTLMNFGPPASSGNYMIYGAGDNWDVDFGPYNHIYVKDYTPRNIFIENGSHIDANSFVRVHDNVIACWPGSQNTGCSVAQAGTGFIMDGNENRFYHNNIAFFSPDVEFICSNPSSGGCFGNQANDNQMEQPQTGTTTSGIVVYGGGQLGMQVAHDVMVMQATGASPISPLNGSATLVGARINFDVAFQNAAATPLVALNNLTGQTGNFSVQNECATGIGAPGPCPLIHTTGANINQWNADNWPVLTFSASTTASYTFSQTYGASPHCTIPPNIPGTATTLTITTLNTTTLTITASASNSGTVFANCSAGDGQ